MLKNILKLVGKRSLRGAKPRNVKQLGFPSPYTDELLTRVRVRPNGPHEWSVKLPVSRKPKRGVVTRENNVARINKPKWTTELEEQTIQGYIIEGYNPKTKTWEWIDRADVDDPTGPFGLERTLNRWRRALIEDN